MKKLLFILIVAFAVVSASFAAEVKPMAMKNSAVGGAALNVYTPGVEGGEGVNNVGLLIRTWGKVTAVDAENSVFFISDGTATRSSSDVDVTVPGFWQGDYVECWLFCTGYEASQFRGQVSETVYVGEGRIA